PCRDPAPHREHRDLTEGDHPDPPVEQPEAERNDRVDRDAREGRDPVGAEQRRDGEEHEQEQHGDDHRTDGDAATDPEAPHDQCPAREIVTTRCRERTSKATIARTNGAVVRYWVTETYGVSTAWTTPTRSPPKSVAQSDRRRPISAAANAEMTRNVKAE